MDKYPNMTCAQFEYLFVLDALGIFTTVTCICGKNITLTESYNLSTDDASKISTPKFQTIPEDEKTLEITRTLLAMKKRPGLYFGSNPTYSCLRSFLVGYGLGTRNGEEIYWSQMSSDVDREFRLVNDGHNLSEQEQFTLYLEAFETVLRRDYPEFVKIHNL